MTISDVEFALKNIIPDVDAEPHAELSDAKPLLFAILCFELCDCKGLVQLVDEMREKKGLLPMLPTHRHPDDYDHDGWYNIFIDVNDYGDLRVADQINVVVQSRSAADDFRNYRILLSDEVRLALYPHLDVQSKKLYGASLSELLAEVRKYWGVSEIKHYEDNR